MATTESLADIAQRVSALSTKIQGEGIDVTDPKVIVATATELLNALDILQPHINRAERAFGGQKDAQNRLVELKNKLNNVIAAYK